MSAMKDRLTRAADLLGMDPADLLAKLDAPTVDPGLAGRAFAAGEIAGRLYSGEAPVLAHEAERYNA